MSATLTAPRETLVRDLVSLAKPRVTLMVVVTTAGGLALAGGVDLLTALWTVLGTALVVGSANTLNCWLERDIDRHMARTKDRPLPAGRLAPNVALLFGIALACVSIPLLTWGVNALTGALAALALVSYVCVYTPMKQVSPAALLVGSVPGALPPLIGWTAATGRLEWAGIALFGILFFWQLPHFIAIAIFRESEYSNAGFKVLPAVRGVRVAKVHAAVHTVLLIAVSFTLVTLDVAGTVYLVSMVALSVYFGWVMVKGLNPDAGVRWARQLFGASLVYLPLLFVALAVDALL